MAGERREGLEGGNTGGGGARGGVSFGTTGAKGNCRKERGTGGTGQTTEVTLQRRHNFEIRRGQGHESTGGRTPGRVLLLTTFVFETCAAPSRPLLLPGSFSVPDESAASFSPPRPILRSPGVSQAPPPCKGSGIRRKITRNHFRFDPIPSAPLPSPPLLSLHLKSAAFCACLATSSALTDWPACRELLCNLNRRSSHRRNFWSSSQCRQT